MNVCFPSVHMANELENRMRIEQYTSTVSFLLDCEKLLSLRKDNNE
jgi:hypothetical protein